MGDAQNGLDTWGRLVRGSFRARPDVAFYLMAGDLVNRGNERDDWDEFFENARGVFDRRPLVPVLGNHECQGGRPTLYLEQFALPRNGPTNIEPERAYTLQYGNALLVVLDSNLAPEKQTPWLEEQLKSSPARWKIVAYHHPAYSSGLNRDNKALRTAWTPIFDAYGVDLALQGHDHAYLRTHPLRAGEKVAPSKGTTYIVSVSGTKWYPQAEHPETAVGFTDIATWQVLDLQVHGDRLFYKAYDRHGRLKDEFVIDKTDPGSN
jgi:3',5'-cyclic AMP phosphodiesterase CpdA